MKKVFVIISLLFLCAINAVSQVYDKQCYYGISFEKSENKNWGYGELVITDVEPNSPAEAAGIKVNDIIMEINDKATFLRDNVTIAEWLFDNPDPVVTFTIRNVDTYFKEYTLNRECITVNSVSEHYLATIFSFYSLEDTRQQSFILPLKVNPHAELDYTDYHTFGFYDEEGSTDSPTIDGKVKAILETSLIKKGLKKDTVDPDIWVNVYYEYTKNPLFTGIDDPGAKGKTLRFNTETKQMDNLPIYEVDAISANTKSQYIAEVGFVFYDKKNIDKEKYTQIWECNIKDYLSDDISLEQYAKFHIPLIIMQYPYASMKTQSEYFVSFSKYNYTGLHFDADNMETINDVTIDSPAFAAGLRPGYTINKINGKSFDFTKNDFSESYRSFIEDTQSYRDTSTRFVGLEGYEDCMFWNVAHYSDIAKQFKKAKYLTNFSYLYDFEKYVNPNYSGTIVVEGSDGVQKRIFTIKPLIRESVVIKAL